MGIQEEVGNVRLHFLLDESPHKPVGHFVMSRLWYDEANRYCGDSQYWEGDAAAPTEHHPLSF